jgi:hypothetical protein
VPEQWLEANVQPLESIIIARVSGGVALGRSDLTTDSTHRHPREDTLLSQNNRVPPNDPTPARITSSVARLAQSVERETLNLKVAGSTPASGSIPGVVFSKTEPSFLMGRFSFC